MEVILTTSRAAVREAISTIRAAAADYLPKPLDVGHLLQRLANLVVGRRATLPDSPEGGTPAPETLEERTGIVGRSAEMVQLRGRIGAIADSDTAVLVTGESGTGKELVARAHPPGEPPARPARWWPSTAAALPAGADRGRAVRPRARGLHRGRSQARRPLPGRRRRHPVPGRDRRSAARGAGQAAARAAGGRVRAGGQQQDHAGRRAGGLGDQPGPARRWWRPDGSARTCCTGCGSSRSPSPPLRQRMEDLPLLVRALLGARAPGRGSRPALSAAAWDALMRYPFPGNVRELENTINHALVMARGQPEILPRHLPAEVADHARAMRRPDRPRALRCPGGGAVRARRTSGGRWP